MRTIETSVLILGGGPVGLALALDLASRGQRCVLVEQVANQPVLHPRAGGLAARTMEFCRRWGIDGDVKACGFPRDREMDVVFCTTLSGHTLGRQKIAALGEREVLPFSPEIRERCPQIWFDPILARAVARHPEHVTALYQHTLLAFEQTETEVVAEVRDDRSGELLRVVAPYFVAADGNDSPVRQALGVGVEGEPVLSYSVNAILRSPELNARNPQGEGARYLFIGPNGTWSNMTVINGTDLWRITLIGKDSKMDLASVDMADVVRRAWGTDQIPFEILTVAPWRRKELNATHYQVGRVFLAGDAAHAMSPTGGMGMNTGMGDAVDLGWKLTAMLQGWGGAALMDSYEVERRPVGGRNARWSSGNFKNWKSNAAWPGLLDDTPAGAQCRAEVGRNLVDSLRDEWLSWGIQLGYRYEGSPLIVPDGTPEPPDPPGEYEQTARPGARAPHAWVAPGRSTIDWYGRGFVLLDFGAPAGHAAQLQSAARSRGVPLEVIHPDAAEVAQLYERKLVLVRPDGHVAWRADALDTDALDLVDTVRGARPVAPAKSTFPRGRLTLAPP